MPPVPKVIITAYLTVQFLMLRVHILLSVFLLLCVPFKRTREFVICSRKHHRLTEIMPVM
jgi:nitrate reductase gamma subunit